MIKPIDGFTGVSDADVLSRGTNVQTCMTGNANFSTPPVDLAALKTAIEAFSGLIAQSLNGSKKVIAEKNKQRRAVINMLRLLIPLRFRKRWSGDHMDDDALAPSPGRPVR